LVAVLPVAEAVTSTGLSESIPPVFEDPDVGIVRGDGEGDLTVLARRPGGDVHRNEWTA